MEPLEIYTAPLLADSWPPASAGGGKSTPQSAQRSQVRHQLRCQGTVLCFLGDQPTRYSRAVSAIELNNGRCIGAFSVQRVPKKYCINGFCERLLLAYCVEKRGYDDV